LSADKRAPHQSSDIQPRHSTDTAGPQIRWECHPILPVRPSFHSKEEGQSATHCNVSPSSWGPARKSASIPIPAAQTSFPSHTSNGSRSRSHGGTADSCNKFLSFRCGPPGVRRIRSRPALNSNSTRPAHSKTRFRPDPTVGVNITRMPTASRFKAGSPRHATGACSECTRAGTR
jgi:hypothetical protein